MPNVILGNPGMLNGSIKANYVADPKIGVRKTGSFVQMVAAESVNTGTDSIITTPGLPILYGFYQGMWCRSITPEDAGPGKHPVTNVDTTFWRVTSAFDSELDTQSGGIGEDPLMRPVVITRDSVVVDERIWFDVMTGAQIQNAVGEPILCTGPYVMPVFTFTRFEPYPYADSEILRLTNAANASPFRGAPIGTALMLKVRTNEVTIKNVRYEQVGYTVQFKLDRYNPLTADTWTKQRQPHQGFFYKVPDKDNPTQPKIPVKFSNTNPESGHADGSAFNLYPNGVLKKSGLPPDEIAFNRIRTTAFPAF